MLVLLHNQKCYADGYQNGDVEHGVRARQAIQPSCRQTVDSGVDNGQRGHGADDMVLRRRISEPGANGDGRKKHLRGAIFRRGYAADLANEA